MTCNRLRDYSKKDAVWDKHKGDAIKIAELLANDVDFEKYAQRLHETAQEIGFSWVDDATTGETRLKLKQAWFSRWRHDPVSNWRKTLRWRALWFAALPRIFADYPTHRWLFVTLTVENCKIEDLNATCRHLNQAFVRLRKTGVLGKYFNKRGDKTNAVAGYYKAMEVTKEKDREGYAHPHLHILFHVPAGYFDAKNYITQETWTTMWQKAARLDYKPMVDVRVVKAKKGAANVDLTAKMLDAVLEVTKYPTKSADLLKNAAWTKGYIRQMNRIRLTDLGGTLRNYINDDIDNDDLIHIDDETESLIDDTMAKLLFFKFDEKKSVRKYVKKTENP